MANSIAVLIFTTEDTEEHRTDRLEARLLGERHQHLAERLELLG